MQEMLQNLNSPSSSNLSVLERQRSRLQWQQSFDSLNETNNFGFDSLISLPISPQNLNSDQYFSNDGSASSLKNKKEGTSKKRKAGKSPTAISNEGEKEKRSKHEDSPEKFTENGSPLPPPPPPPKQDFIHVRARRGQATDSHSLAERVRREKISERMKYLQELVPGCSKIIGKAGMLDEIINYVQSLQRQVEFLSMKLATVNPSIDFNIDSFFPKEANLACDPNIQTIDASAEMIETYLQMNTMHQMAACCGLNIDLDASELALRRSLSSSIAIHDTFLDASFNVHNSSWDANSESICDVEFHQGKGSMLPLQSLSGSYSPNNLKMEM